MEKLKQLCLASLMAALLGLNLTVPVLAQDGGDDGGLDDGGADDAGSDNDQGHDQDKDDDGQPDKDGDGHGHKGGHDTMENIITIIVIHIMAAGRPGVSALVRSAICRPTTRPRITAIRLQPAGSFHLRYTSSGKKRPNRPNLLPDLKRITGITVALPRATTPT